jgi:hypothetical protein
LCCDTMRRTNETYQFPQNGLQGRKRIKLTDLASAAKAKVSPTVSAGK